MNPIAFVRNRPWWQIAAAVIILAAGGWRMIRPARPSGPVITVDAKRGPLDIKVLSGGNVEALESQEIKCEVRGEQIKILKLVDEGYSVSAEDVRTNKVLVELDSSKLRQNLADQEISFQGTIASLTEAQQAFEIQVTQNRVDVKAAEQKAKFARMDLEKFLGDRIANDILARLNLREVVDTNLVAIIENGEIPDDDHEALGGRTNGMARLPKRAAETIDFTRYAKPELLGDGSAKQQLRKLDDELLVARTELGLAEAKLAGTKRLFDKGFVTKSEMENEQVNTDKARLKVDSAKTALDLFIKYEFVKTAEETVSKYDEALRGLERARKEAVSKLAQARAKLKGAEGRFAGERQRLEQLREQIGKCTIVAKVPGLVVYGSPNDPPWRSEERIRVGAAIWERTTILTIPDMSKMGVKLGIHESHIKKVKKGLRVRVIADAFPDDPLEGEVSHVAVIADGNRWFNPDSKTYQTTVRLAGARDWLKPGMSAKVEIMVKRLPDVVYVPLQAVTLREGRQVVYLAGTRPEPRPVETGEFNDEFIEVRKGLDAGASILLRAPDDEKRAGDKPAEGKPASTPSAPAPAAKVTAAP